MDSITDADIDENILMKEDESPAFAGRREDDGINGDEAVDNGALGRFGTLKHIAAALGGWHWVGVCVFHVHLCVHTQIHARHECL
jgi:hypothetical protein